MWASYPIGGPCRGCSLSRESVRSLNSRPPLASSLILCTPAAARLVRRGCRAAAGTRGPRLPDGQRAQADAAPHQAAARPALCSAQIISGGQRPGARQGQMRIEKVPMGMQEYKCCWQWGLAVVAGSGCWHGLQLDSHRSGSVTSGPQGLRGPWQPGCNAGHKMPNCGARVESVCSHRAHFADDRPAPIRRALTRMAVVRRAQT